MGKFYKLAKSIHCPDIPCADDDIVAPSTDLSFGVLYDRAGMKFVLVVFIM